MRIIIILIEVPLLQLNTVLRAKKKTKVRPQKKRNHCLVILFHKPDKDRLKDMFISCQRQLLRPVHTLI